MNAVRCDDSPQAVGSQPATIDQYHQAAHRPLTKMCPLPSALSKSIRALHQQTADKII